MQIRVAVVGVMLGLVLVVACSSGGGSASGGGPPDPAAYGGACAVDDDCASAFSQECGPCAPKRVAVLASRSEAYGVAQANYLDACASSVVCPEIFQDGTTVHCKASACVTDKIAQVPGAEDLFAGCTADADCVMVSDVQGCCRGCGMAILARRAAEYATALARHEADCRRASPAVTTCPGAACPSAGKAVCGAGTGIRRCIRA